MISSVIPATGVFVIPLIYPRYVEEQSKKRVHLVKNQYEPLVFEEIKVYHQRLEHVFYSCKDWLELIKGAKIYESNEFDYILAFHEVYDTHHDFDDLSIPSSSKPINLPKFFMFRLSKDEKQISILVEIYSGWQEHPIDGKRRTQDWLIFFQELKQHLSSNEIMLLTSDD
jgi:hypothetical protein